MFAWHHNLHCIEIFTVANSQTDHHVAWIDNVMTVVLVCKRERERRQNEESDEGGDDCSVNGKRPRVFELGICGC